MVVRLMNNRSVDNGGGNNRGVDHGGVVDGGVDNGSVMVWGGSGVVHWFRMISRSRVVSRLRMVGWSRMVGGLRMVGRRGRSRVRRSNVVHSCVDRMYRVDRVHSVVDWSGVVHCVYCMVGNVGTVGYNSTMAMGNYMGGNQRGGGS